MRVAIRWSRTCWVRLDEGCWVWSVVLLSRSKFISVETADRGWVCLLLQYFREALRNRHPSLDNDEGLA